MKNRHLLAEVGAVQRSRAVLSWMVMVALIFPLASPGAAQEAISGVVLDDTSGRPVVGATVRLFLGDQFVSGASSDQVGRFSFQLPGPGEWQIEAERIGYRTARSSPLVVDIGMVLDVEFRLRTEAVLIEPLLVTASSRAGRDAFARRTEDWGRGTFFGPDDINAMDLQYSPDFFRHVDGAMMTWGFGQDESGRWGPLPNVRVFKGRGCLNYMVDWVPVRLSPFMGSSNPWGSYQLAGITPEDIQAVEIYKYPGEAPPQIRRYVNQSRIIFTDTGMERADRDLCGLVVIWTKAAW